MTAAATEIDVFSTGCFEGRMFGEADLERMARASKRVPVTRDGKPVGAVLALRRIGNRLVGVLAGPAAALQRLAYSQLRATVRDDQLAEVALLTVAPMTGLYLAERATDGSLCISFAVFGLTPPDPRDGHSHAVAELDADGNGLTAEAGEPPHAHRIHGWLVEPITAGEHHSTHPGELEPDVQPTEMGEPMKQKIMTALNPRAADATAADAAHTLLAAIDQEIQQRGGDREDLETRRTAATVVRRQRPDLPAQPAASWTLAIEQPARNRGLEAARLAEQREHRARAVALAEQARADEVDDRILAALARSGLARDDIAGRLAFVAARGRELRASTPPAELPRPWLAPAHHRVLAELGHDRTLFARVLAFAQQHDLDETRALDRILDGLASAGGLPALRDAATATVGLAAVLHEHGLSRHDPKQLGAAGTILARERRDLLLPPRLLEQEAAAAAATTPTVILTEGSAEHFSTWRAALTTVARELGLDLHKHAEKMRVADAVAADVRFRHLRGTR